MFLHPHSLLPCQSTAHGPDLQSVCSCIGRKERCQKNERRDTTRWNVADLILCQPRLQNGIYVPNLHLPSIPLILDILASICSIARSPGIPSDLWPSKVRSSILNEDRLGSTTSRDWISIAQVLFSGPHTRRKQKTKELDVEWICVGKLACSMVVWKFLKCSLNISLARQHSSVCS